MSMHRLTVPSYFGGLPGGYDYINNALSGTPAFADGAKSSGPNTGSYFIAFQEDGTNANANRPMKALAQNTDFLDDLLHRDIAVPVRTSDGTGAPTTDVTITGPGIFMGLVGAVITDLFHITDTSDQDIDVAGTKIVAASAVDSGAVPIGGGFSVGNVDVTFNIPIPSGQDFRIYYAERTNWATFPADGLTNTRIRNLTEVDFLVEEMFRLLHGNSEAWNDPWDSTIWDLTARGLDGAYRRATVGVAGAFNTAGSGGTITRDGPSPGVQGTQTARAYVDPVQALFSAFSRELGADRSAHPYGSGGFFFAGSEWMVKGNSPTTTQPTPSLFSFLGVTRHTEPFVTGSPPAGTGYATFIPAGSHVTLTTTATDGVYSMALTDSGTFFWNPAAPTSGQTAIGLGIDYFEVTLSGFGTTAMVVTSFDTTDATGKTAHVTTLDGGEFTGLTLPISGTVTWVAPRVGYRYGAAMSKNIFNALPLGSESYFDAGLFVLPPFSGLTDDVTTATGHFSQVSPPTTAFFGAHVDHVTGLPNTAIAWGPLDYDMSHVSHGEWLTLGALMADGGIRGTSLAAPIVGSNLMGFLDLGLAGTATNLLEVTTIGFALKNAGSPGSPVITPTLGAGFINGEGTIRGTAHLPISNGYSFTTSAGAITVDFTTEQIGSSFVDSAPLYEVCYVYATASAIVNIATLKLPVNVDVGTKFRLILIPASGSAAQITFSSSDITVIGSRTGAADVFVIAPDVYGAFAPGYEVPALPLYPAPYSGPHNRGFYVFELTAVFCIPGTIATYMLTHYSASHAD